MVQSPVGRIDPRILAQIMGPDEPLATTSAVSGPAKLPDDKGIPTFNDILNKAVDSLEGVSSLEGSTNALINQYVQGKAELSDVMVATAKLNITMQLAVTAMTSVVNTFKEITQMQI